jgi:predicted nucleic acid-binding Zn ribbon protein
MPAPEGHKRRYKKTVSMAEALDMSPFLKRLGVRDGDKQMEVYRRWSEVVGESVARNTQPVRFSKGVLSVTVSSAAWLHNLTMMKPQILKNLAREFGQGFVSDLRFRAADFDMGKLKGQA